MGAAGSSTVRWDTSLSSALGPPWFSWEGGFAPKVEIGTEEGKRQGIGLRHEVITQICVGLAWSVANLAYLLLF